MVDEARVEDWRTVRRGGAAGGGDASSGGSAVDWTARRARMGERAARVAEARGRREFRGRGAGVGGAWNRVARVGGGDQASNVGTGAPVGTTITAGRITSTTIAANRITTVGSERAVGDRWWGRGRADPHGDNVARASDATLLFATAQRRRRAAATSVNLVGHAGGDTTTVSATIRAQLRIAIQPAATTASAASAGSTFEFARSTTTDSTST